MPRPLSKKRSRRHNRPLHLRLLRLERKQSRRCSSRLTPATTTGDVKDDPSRLKPSRGQRLPFGNAESPTDASTVVRSSESSRNSHALASRTRATSDTTVSKTASRSACRAISRVTRRSAPCCSCSPTTTLVGGATRPPSSTGPAADSNALRRVSSHRAAAWHAKLERQRRSGLMHRGAVLAEHGDVLAQPSQCQRRRAARAS